MVPRLRSVAFPRCTNSLPKPPQELLLRVTLMGATSPCALRTGSFLGSLMCVPLLSLISTVRLTWTLDHWQLWCVLQLRKSHPVIESSVQLPSSTIKPTGSAPSPPSPQPASRRTFSVVSLGSLFHSCVIYGTWYHISHATLSLGLRHHYGSFRRCALWRPRHAHPQRRRCLRRSSGTIRCCCSPWQIRRGSYPHPALLGRYLCHQRRAHRRIQHLDLRCVQSESTMATEVPLVVLMLYMRDRNISTPTRLRSKS